MSSNENNGYIFCRYIKKNGKTIYPKNARFFRFPARNQKSK